jgi:hypothetical protein
MNRVSSTSNTYCGEYSSSPDGKCHHDIKGRGGVNVNEEEDEERSTVSSAKRREKILKKMYLCSGVTPSERENSSSTSLAIACFGWPTRLEHKSTKRDKSLKKGINIKTFVHQQHHLTERI